MNLGEVICASNFRLVQIRFPDARQLFYQYLNNKIINKFENLIQVPGRTDGVRVKTDRVE